MPRSNHYLFAVIYLCVICAGCSSQQSSIPKSASSEVPLRHVILFNDGDTVVTVATDTEAFQAVVAFMGSPSSDAANAQVNAARIDGRLFDVANGTRADVIKDAPLRGVPNMSLLRVRIRNGPHIAEEVLCFSSVTQPDTGR